MITRFPTLLGHPFSCTNNASILISKHKNVLRKEPFMFNIKVSRELTQDNKRARSADLLRLQCAVSALFCQESFVMIPSSTKIGKITSFRCRRKKVWTLCALCEYAAGLSYLECCPEWDHVIPGCQGEGTP